MWWPINNNSFSVMIFRLFDLFVLWIICIYIFSRYSIVQISSDNDEILHLLFAKLFFLQKISVVMYMICILGYMISFCVYKQLNTLGIGLTKVQNAICIRKMPRFFEVVLVLKVQDDLLTNRVWWTVINTRQFYRPNCFLLQDRNFLMQKAFYSKISHHVILHVKCLNLWRKWTEGVILAWKLFCHQLHWKPVDYNQTKSLERKLYNNANASLCCS